MSDNSIHVRVTGSQFRYDGEQYVEGETLEVHARALEKHPQTLAAVDDSDADDAGNDQDQGDADAGDDAESVTVDDLDPHPDDLTVSELEDRVQTVDDVAMLETILEGEREDGSPRTTAVEAIEARISELEG